MATAPTYVEGTVIEPTVGAKPQYYNILPDQGQRLNGVPRLLTNPGDADVLPSGTRVLVCLNAPRGPIIYGALPGYEAGTNEPFITENDSAPQPGDRVLKSPDGNFVGALSGGMSLISSGGMAQVRTSDTGHVDIFSQTFTHQTQASETKITTDEDGASNHSFRLGVNTDHAGPLAENKWILRIDAGAKGDVLRIAVTTPDNQELSHVHFTAGGRVEILARDGMHTQVQEQATQMVVGTNVRQVEGNEVIAVSGARTETYGNLTHSVTGAEDVSAAARTTTISGTERVAVSGSRLVQVGEDDIKLVCGESETVYGPTYDARTLLASMSSTASWINYSGGFNFALLPSAGGSSFSVISSMPGCVQLGVDGAPVRIPGTDKHTVAALPGIFSAVMYEPLAIWFGQLLLWLDTHTHGTAVGPSTPPVFPIGPQLNPNMTTFQSQRVKIGL